MFEVDDVISSRRTQNIFFIANANKEPLMFDEKTFNRPFASQTTKQYYTENYMRLFGLIKLINDMNKRQR